MVNLLIAYILGLATAIIFYKFISSQLKKLYTKNK